MDVCPHGNDPRLCEACWDTQFCTPRTPLNNQITGDRGKRVFKHIIALMVASSFSLAMTKKQPEVSKGPYAEAPEGVSLVQCTTYPTLGEPQNPSFIPQKYPWPKISGIGQNQMGPYACKHLLPSSGIKVGGGEWGWPVSDSPARKVSKAEADAAILARRSLSSGQKWALLTIEAGNANWVRALSENSIRVTPIEISVKCLLDHAIYVTDDGKHYYRNMYRYLGIVPEDKSFLPPLQLRDYLAPSELAVEIKKMCGE